MISNFKKIMVSSFTKCKIILDFSDKVTDHKYLIHLDICKSDFHGKKKGHIWGKGKRHIFVLKSQTHFCDRHLQGEKRQNADSLCYSILIETTGDYIIDLVVIWHTRIRFKGGHNFAIA